MMIELSNWLHVKEAFRSKHLRQAGYTEGAIVMEGTLLDLHGLEHRERRRLENRLFRREIFSYWEHEILGQTIDATMKPFVEKGAGDLAQIGYRCAMNLTATIAGIDQDPRNEDQTELMYSMVKKFSEGATIMHSTRDKDEVRAEVKKAMESFHEDFFLASKKRREALISDFESGKISEESLPRDVFTTLLRNAESLNLDEDVVFREICFYLQAGAHSTANAFTHTVDDLFSWGEQHPDDLKRARNDLPFVQRCMHESLRLSPASPVALRTPLEDVELSDGTLLPMGSHVVLNLIEANRDPEIFGDTANIFDPHREVPDGVARWGMSFGAGSHACVGAELDGGLEIDESRPSEESLYGTVSVMVHALLSAGGRKDEKNPPELDLNSERKHFSKYPVVFTSESDG
ncbi:MAG: cytochrome P450 [Acidimicrobiaceae bacterium]|nr:cytochrome P450 [Acidimicrobiaceae bacterium]|tara:strand:- start:1075 stop:2286 length:1212 start_codon:yes stop_codon:yes gene_type:complete